MKKTKKVLTFFGIIFRHGQLLTNRFYCMIKVALLQHMSQRDGLIRNALARYDQGRRVGGHRDGLSGETRLGWYHERGRNRAGHVGREELGRFDYLVGSVEDILG